jgi:hypothetical protein
VELEGSQQPTTGPYPELDKSSSHPPPNLPPRSIPTLSSYLSLGLPSGFLTKVLYTFLITPMLHALAISSILIIFDKEYIL